MANLVIRAIMVSGLIGDLSNDSSMGLKLLGKWSVPSVCFFHRWELDKGVHGTEKPLRHTSSLHRSVESSVGCFHTRQV